MARHARDRDADFHAPAMAAPHLAIGGIGNHDAFRADVVFVDEVLPAEAVAILFLHRADHVERVIARQIEVFDDFRAINHAGQRAFLIRRAAPVNDAVLEFAFIRVMRPRGGIADADGIHMRVNRQNCLAVADAPYNIAHRVNRDFIEPDAEHFLLDMLNNAPFLTTFRRNGDQFS